MTPKNRTRSATRASRPPALRLHPVAWAVLLLAADGAGALPQGPQPTRGQTTVRQTGATQLRIDQTSQNAGIDWRSFSIGAAERVQIVQPGRDAVLLNRVVGSDPSAIYGSLDANGRVFLINPRGIVFGPGSQVSVGSLVASTLDWRGGDLGGGRLVLGRADGSARGSIVAQGAIRAADTVALVAPEIVAGGTIDARRVALGAATQATVDVEGDGLVLFDVRNDGSLATRLEQLGRVRADGGSAELRAAARTGFADTVLNLEGVVQARSLGQREGRIVIDGGADGVTRVAGRIDASGDAAGTRGGTVDVLGNKVGLASTARVDASGDAGGGSVRLGGDLQGRNPDVRNASMLTIQTGAVVQAGATATGDGGRVIAWSDGATRFGGTIAVRGGTAGGDGGFVEVSGHEHLDFQGAIDAAAPRGRAGAVLLDPKSLQINESGADINGPAAGAADLTGDTLAFGTFPAADPSIITKAAVNTRLATGGATVTLQAQDTITVGAGATSISGPGMLVLQAGGDITINASITASGGLRLIANDAGGTPTGSGRVVTSTGVALGAGTATLEVSGVGTHHIGGNLSAGTLSITGGVELTADSTWSISGTTTSIGSSISGAHRLTKTGGGTLTLTNGNGYSGGTTVNGGTLAVSGAAARAGTATITVDSSGRLDANDGADIGNAISLAGGTVGNGAGAGAGTVSGPITLAAPVGTLRSDGAGLVVAAPIGQTGGARALTVTGSGGVTFDVANTYTGTTTVNGLLKLGDNELIDSDSTLVVDGGTLDLGTFTNTFAGVRLQGDGRIDNGSVTSASNYDLQSGSVGAELKGAVDVGKTTGGTVTLAGANSYGGRTSIEAGVLVLDADSVLPDTTDLVVTGGELRMATHSDVVHGVSLQGGSITGSGGVGNAVLTSATAVDARAGSISASLAGAVALVKSTAGGTVRLSGANSYAGGTQIDAGTLAVAGDTASAGAGPITIAAGARLQIDDGAEIAVAVTSDGGTVGNGAGAGTLSGGLTLGAASTLDSSGTGTGLVIRTLGIGDGGNGFGITVTGSGGVTFDVANTYTGTTTVQGPLNLGVADLLPHAGALVVDGGTVDLGGFAHQAAGVQLKGDGSIADGTLASMSDFDLQSGSISASLAGAVALVKSTAGTVRLSGANSYGGATSIGEGTLTLDADGVLPDTTTVTVAGGALAIGARTDAVAKLVLESGSVTGSSGGLLTSTQDFDLQSGSVGAALGGAVGLVKTTGGSVTLSGANAYSGGTTVSGGTLAVGADDVLPDSTPVVVDGGTLAIGARTDTVQSVSLRSGSITGSSGGVLASATDFDLRAGNVGAALAGTTAAVGAQKTTGGSVTLGGANAFGGTLTLGEGTLALSASDVLPDAAALVVAGATLAVGAHSDTVASLRLDAGSITGTTGVLTSIATPELRKGSVGAILGGSAGLSKTTAETVELAGANVYGGETTVSGGTLKLGAAAALPAASPLVIANGSTVDLGAFGATAAGLRLVDGTLTSGTLSSAGTFDLRKGSIDAALAGSGAVAKSTADTVTLAGTNVYTGGTSITGGSLQLGAAGALPDTGTVTVGGGTLDLGGFAETVGTLRVDGGSVIAGVLRAAAAFDLRSGSVAAALSGPSGATKSGAGTVTLTGTNDYTGDTTVEDGTLATGAAAVLPDASHLVVAGGSFDLGGFADTVAGVQLTGGSIANGTLTSTSDFDLQAGSATASLAGAVGATKSGGGTVTLAGTNTYTGPTTVDGGTLRLALAAALPSGSVVANGGTLDLGGFTVAIAGLRLAGGSVVGGTLDATSDYDIRSGSASAALAGAVGLDKTTGGSATLSGTNTYSGTTSVEQGTLVAASPGALGDTAGTTSVADGATLAIAATALGPETVTIAGGGVGAAGALQGSGSASLAGTARLGADATVGVASGGTLALALLADDGTTHALAAVGPGTLVVADANAHVGSTTLEGGTFRLGASAVLADAGTLVVAGGTLDLNGAAETVAGVRITGGSIANGTLVSTSDFDLRAGNVSAILAGAIGATKSGGGAVTLSGANTYSGPTSVVGGALTLGAAASLPVTTSVVANGGTLDLGSFAVDVAGVTLAGGSIANGTLTSASDFDLQAGSVSAILAGAVGATKTGSGTVTLSGANTYTGTTTVAAGTLGLGANEVLADASRLVVAGGSFDLGGFADTVVGVQITGGSIANGTLTSTSDFDLLAGSASAVLAGAVGATKTGSGMVTLSGANTYTGGTTVGGGVLELGADGVLPDTTDLVVTAGELRMTTHSDLVHGVSLQGGSITGSGSAGNAVLTSASDFDLQAGSVSAILAGAVGATKTGSGTVMLSGANRYTGATQVDAGTLALAAPERLPDGTTLGVGPAARLTLGGDETVAAANLAGTLDGSGALNAATVALDGAAIAADLGAGALVSDGMSRLDGRSAAETVVVRSGTLGLGSAGRLVAAPALTIDAGATLALGGDETVATALVAGTLAGVGTLTATAVALDGGAVGADLSAGSLRSTGASRLDGASAALDVAIDAGSLTLGAAERIADGATVTVAGGATLVLGGAETIGRLAGGGRLELGSAMLATGAAGDSTFDGVIAGTGALVKQGAARFTLAGANDYTGGTEVAAGTLALDGDERLADTGTVAVAVGSTLELSGNERVASLEIAGTLAGVGTLTAAGVTLDGATIAANLGDGALVSHGASTLAGRAAAARVELVDGTLALGSAHRLAEVAKVDVAAGARIVLGGDETIGTLAGDGDVVLGAATLATGTAGDSAFGGVISGSGSLVKQGASRFTLAGANAYTGSTEVAGGTLALAASGRLAAAGTLAVDTGATLELGGDQSVAAATIAGTLAGSGTLAAATIALDGATVLANLGTGTLSSRGTTLLAGTSAATSVEVEAGTLTTAAAERLADGATLAVDAGATMVLGGDETVDRATIAGTLESLESLSPAVATLAASTVELNGGSVRANLGGGTLASHGASVLAGTSAAARIDVVDGTLTLASAARLTALPALEVAAGATLVQGGDERVGTLGGAGDIELGSATLTTGAGGDSRFDGVLAGSGGLTKEGGSALTLTGANRYTGTTTVAGGMLVVGDGASSGSLAGGPVVVDGVLRSARSDEVRYAMPIGGSGAFEQAGSGTLVLAGSNKTYTGATRVQSGSLATAGDEDLPDTSAITVAAGTQLSLAGRETVGSIDADGELTVGGDLAAGGDLLLRGAVVAAAGRPLTLSGSRIDAVADGNRWGSALSVDARGPLAISAGRDGSGALRDLTLGDLRSAAGGRIDAGAITLGGLVELGGGTLALVADAPALIAEPGSELAGKVTPTQLALAFAADVVTQAAASRIDVADGALLSLAATRGGSVALLSAANRVAGGIEIRSGGPTAPWTEVPVPAGFGGRTATYSMQGRVRLAGSELQIGGAGIEADVVAIAADRLATAPGAVIVARLPFDNLAGTLSQIPGLTLELSSVSFGVELPYGSLDAPIAIDVGSRAFGSRTSVAIDGGYLSVLPRGGANGTTAVIVSGPEVGGGYGFFFDGAGRQGDIPVFYNGALPITPQLAGSISSTIAVSEGARKERFDEAVRTENVALRLRAGVIAEVGPGRPATVGTEGARPPASCAPAGATLGCTAAPDPR